jgi:hypothetical protein
MTATHPLHFDKKEFSGHRVVEPKKRARHGAAVSFAPTILLHEVPHNNDHSDEERREMWWGDDDLAMMRLKCLITVRMMEEMGSEFQETDGKTSHGLENFTSTRDETRRKRRRLAADAVLQEQVRQWSRDIHDPELISKSYQEVSLLCQRESCCAALRDEETVKEEPPLQAKSTAIPTQEAPLLQDGGCL